MEETIMKLNTRASSQWSHSACKTFLNIEIVTEHDTRPHFKFNIAMKGEINEISLTMVWPQKESVQ